MDAKMLFTGRLWKFAKLHSRNAGRNAVLRPCRLGTQIMKEMEKFRNREMIVPEESDLLYVANYYSTLSEGNVLAIGGTLTLPEISGYKRLRSRSGDVDFVVNDEGLEALLSTGPTKREEDFVPGVDGGAYITEKNGIFAAFFHNGIRGYAITGEDFPRAIRRETSAGPVYTISHELNLALKVRRGIHKKGQIYGKDVLDAASTLIGMELTGQDFDAETFADYLIGACRGSSLVQILGYVSRFADAAVSNVSKEHVKPYLAKLSECAAYVEERGGSLQPDAAYAAPLPAISTHTYDMFDVSLPEIGKERNAASSDLDVDDYLSVFAKFTELPGAG